MAFSVPSMLSPEAPSPTLTMSHLSGTDMTGRPGHRTMEMIGRSSASYLARTPCVPLFSTLFSKAGNRKAFRLRGAGGDHVHCTVEPSPGHIRCRICTGFNAHFDEIMAGNKTPIMQNPPFGDADENSQGSERKGQVHVGVRFVSGEIVDPKLMKNQMSLF